MRKNLNYQAELVNVDINKKFEYQKTLMLTADISYPQIRLSGNLAVQSRINRNYKKTATQYFRYTYQQLLPDAISQYRQAIQNGFPFHAFDAVMKYTVTLNANCHLSTYFDQYQYTGGAHGNTIRSSDNWDLQNARRISMASLFPLGTNYRQKVLSSILKQADENIAQNPGIYFEDYRDLIVEYFNPQSFYLTPIGVAVYYQQYEIAPYATGIVVFEIPYADLVIEKPDCRSIRPLH